MVPAPIKGVGESLETTNTAQGEIPFIERPRLANDNTPLLLTFQYSIKEMRGSPGTSY